VADPSAGEARLTDKIIKGFFLKPPCCTPEFPPFYPYVSLSLPLKVHMCICLRAREKRKADQGFFGALRKGFKSVAKSFRLAMQTVRAH
jgi:hypothetical protein